MKVGVIMGGISSEREISLQSGEQVLLYPPISYGIEIPR